MKKKRKKERKRKRRRKRRERRQRQHEARRVLGFRADGDRSFFVKCNRN
jgi:hypothetical protein